MLKTENQETEWAFKTGFTLFLSLVFVFSSLRLCLLVVILSSSCDFRAGNQIRNLFEHIRRILPVIGGKLPCVVLRRVVMSYLVSSCLVLSCFVVVLCYVVVVLWLFCRALCCLVLLCCFVLLSQSCLVLSSLFLSLAVLSR